MNYIWQRSEYSPNGVRIFWEHSENFLQARKLWKGNIHLHQLSLLVSNKVVAVSLSISLSILTFFILSLRSRERESEKKRKKVSERNWETEGERGKNQQVFTWVIFLLVSFVFPLWLNYDRALPILGLF